ncbi:MAG: NUDIX domain-containing protein [Pseudomonadales bacterium]|nr:NUDIX domain-containing protein [Pseudomonadales bacterium]
MSEPIPSATVVTLRETEKGIEILMLRKNSKIAYGGMWVFPGGKIDEADYPISRVSNNDKDIFSAARTAAAREAKEEANIDIESDALHFFAHWTTPNVRPKRFSTWFFIGKVESAEVAIDGGEIHDYAWRTPTDMLEAHRDGEVEMMPPTYITLTRLKEFNNYNSVVDAFSNEEPFYFAPRITVLETGMCHFYGDDAGYETKDVDQAGKRHRLWANKTDGWRYERD